jgi:CspA family cold shock protein
LGRGGPDREPAIGLMSDRSLRGMIEIWFEVEKMKSNHVLVPDFADRLRKCEQRIHGAIMRLANEAALSRSGESGAVALWLEAVARGKAETVSALAELRSKMT